MKANFPSIDLIFKELSKIRKKKTISEGKLHFKNEIQVKNLDFKYKSANKNYFQVLTLQLKKM